MNRLTKITLFFTVMLFCLMWVGCNEAEKTTAAEATVQKDTAEMQFKEIAKGFLEIRNQTDRAKSAGLFEKVIAPDFVMHIPPYGDFKGRDAFVAFNMCALKAFSNFSYQFDEVIVKDDRMVCRWSLKGTNTGPYNYHVASGKDISLSGVSIFRVANGQITEEWQFYNRLALLEQLGYELTTTLAASEVACK
ncbi:MAG: ester cyclase [Candidatus Aminicenantes bacterium]|jgi:predicted ester cyclase